MTLEELLPDGDYRFSFRFERAEPQRFFGPTAWQGALIAQRRSWFENAPQRYAALLPEGEPLLDEMIELALQWGVLESREESFLNFANAWTRCLALGSALEPDFLLLRSEPSGARLVGGAVCFPSSWSLEEKIAHPIASIHQVVPRLNEALGPQIDSFLLKLKPGVAWSRSNWGLSRSPELNQHPSRGIQRLDENVERDEVWLRVENQVLVALPKTKGVLFGIRIVNHGLEEVRRSSVLAGRLARALRTMPESVATYKGLAKVRNRVIELLGL